MSFSPETMLTNAIINYLEDAIDFRGLELSAVRNKVSNYVSSVCEMDSDEESIVERGLENIDSESDSETIALAIVDALSDAGYFDEGIDE